MASGDRMRGIRTRGGWGFAAPAGSAWGARRIGAVWWPARRADGRGEVFAPLNARVCSDCRRVQLVGVEAPPSPGDGPPPEEDRSGVAGWARRMAGALCLGPGTPVAELAGRDATLLGALAGLGAPVLAVDPARPAAAPRRVARETAPFGAATARRLRASGPPPALFAGNDLLARAADLIACALDPKPARQGLLLPGGRLPVRAPGAALAERPDDLLLLPWWRRQAVMAGLPAWGGRCVVATPALSVLSARLGGG